MGHSCNRTHALLVGNGLQIAVAWLERIQTFRCALELDRFVTHVNNEGIFLGRVVRNSVFVHGVGKSKDIGHLGRIVIHGPKAVNLSLETKLLVSRIGCHSDGASTDTDLGH